MKYDKGFIGIGAIIAIIAILVVGGVVYFATKTSTPASQNTGVNNPPASQNAPAQNTANNKPTSAVSHCGMTINSPAANSITSFPVTISGTIDNNNAPTLGCSWQMFEGQAGNAQIYFWDQGNNNWHQINTAFRVPVSNWMTLGPVPFSVTVDFNNGGIGLPPGHPMKVTFTEENASGTGTVDTLDLPLVLQ